MNILVIGNGFDLAHELPTKYTDFLDWVVDQVHFYDYMEKQGAEITRNAIRPKLNIPDNKKREKTSTRSEKQHEIWEYINENFWLEYFLNTPMYQKENWIDFESEISNVIKTLDNDMKSNDETLDDTVAQCSNYSLNNKFCSYLDETKPVMSTYRIIRDTLENDLKNLIRALEIYLADYIDKVKCSKESPDIREIFEKRDEQGNIKSFVSTKVLNFNYTDTFRKVYKIDFDIDFIHGKADISNTIDKNNMVLGIDEYLSDDRKDKDVEFIAFKKYYQRIHKGTGCKYKEWIDVIKGEFADYQIELEKSKTEKNIMLLKAKNNKLKQQYLNKHHVYIFGHSLDITDKDILCDLILNDNVHTTIFYLNKDVLGQQIANLVKVIGQDELIRRTGGSTKTIEFKRQQDMVERKP